MIRDTFFETEYICSYSFQEEVNSLPVPTRRFLDYMMPSFVGFKVLSEHIAKVTVIIGVSLLSACISLDMHWQLTFVISAVSLFLLYFSRLRLIPVSGFLNDPAPILFFHMLNHHGNVLRNSHRRFRLYKPIRAIHVLHGSVYWQLEQWWRGFVILTCQVTLSP